MKDSKREYKVSGEPLTAVSIALSTITNSSRRANPIQSDVSARTQRQRRMSNLFVGSPVHRYASNSADSLGKLLANFWPGHHAPASSDVRIEMAIPPPKYEKFLWQIIFITPRANVVRGSRAEPWNFDEQKSQRLSNRLRSN